MVHQDSGAQVGHQVAHLGDQADRAPGACLPSVVDRVLQPLLESGQPLSTGLGAVVGTGPGRGAALLVGLMGAVMALVALAVRLQRHKLDTPELN